MNTTTATPTPTPHAVCIPVSIGELWDKYTILLIKQSKVKDTEKRKHVEYELGRLQSFMKKYTDFERHPAFIELKHTNESLWEIEDSLRVKEMNGMFDQSFIDLARQVYYTNDIRADIKKQINIEFDSVIHEVKDYIEYASA